MDDSITHNAIRRFRNILLDILARRDPLAGNEIPPRAVFEAISEMERQKIPITSEFQAWLFSGRLTDELQDRAPTARRSP